MIGIALDIFYLAILERHADAATAGAHVASGVPGLATAGNCLRHGREVNPEKMLGIRARTAVTILSPGPDRNSQYSIRQQKLLVPNARVFPGDSRRRQRDSRPLPLL
jgi:hypothetical protein